MIEVIIFLLAVAVALILVLLNKDSSFVGFVALIGVCVVSFFVAYYFQSLFLIVIFSAVIGLIVSYMGYDELVKGRKWFYFISISAFVLEIFEFVMGNSAEGFWLASVSLISFTSVVLSYNKKFIKLCKRHNKV